MPDNDRFQDTTEIMRDAVDHPAPEYDPEVSSTITETITIPKDGGVAEVEKCLRQISRVSGALAARLILGTVVPDNSVPVGAANPMIQHIFNCGVNAGTALAMLLEQRRQQSQVLVPQMGVRGTGMGRA